MSTGSQQCAIDVFALQPIVTPTEEHILPRCLGGRLAKVGLIDKKTNDETGHTIDPELGEALRSIRIITDAKSSDGRPPRALTSIIGDDGKQYTVAAGGVMSQALRISQSVRKLGECARARRARGALRCARRRQTEGAADAESAH